MQPGSSRTFCRPSTHLQWGPKPRPGQTPGSMRNRGVATEQLLPGGAGSVLQVRGRCRVGGWAGRWEVGMGRAPGRASLVYCHVAWCLAPTAVTGQHQPWSQMGRGPGRDRVGRGRHPGNMWQMGLPSFSGWPCVGCDGDQGPKAHTYLPAVHPEFHFSEGFSTNDPGVRHCL